MTSTPSRCMCAGVAVVSLAMAVAGAADETTPAEAATRTVGQPTDGAVHHPNLADTWAMGPATVVLPAHVPLPTRADVSAARSPRAEAAIAALSSRSIRRPASRSATRRPQGLRAVRKARPVQEHARVARHAPARPATTRRAPQRAQRARSVSGPARVVRVPSRARAVRHSARKRATGMNAVVAYAYAQVGSRYVHGASGGGRFDCSGLTMQAYRRAGLRLPHSSGAQAARARSISRSQARPGDLVVGPGHVGIYVGGGYMIDAGNPRVGVSKRRMYGGLHLERF